MEWGENLEPCAVSPKCSAYYPRRAFSIFEDVALDLLMGQTDRNNQRNVVLGVDTEAPPHTYFSVLGITR